MKQDHPMKTEVRKAKIETAEDGRLLLCEYSPVLLAVDANTRRANLRVEVFVLSPQP